MMEDNKKDKQKLDLETLSNEELMDFFSKIDEHIKYLNNSILVPEEE